MNTNNNCDCDCNSNFDPADLLDPDNSVYRRMRSDYPGYFKTQPQHQQSSQSGSYYAFKKPISLKKLVMGLIIFSCGGILSTIIVVVVSILIRLF